MTLSIVVMMITKMEGDMAEWKEGRKVKRKKGRKERRKWVGRKERREKWGKDRKKGMNGFHLESLSSVHANTPVPTS